MRLRSVILMLGSLVLGLPASGTGQSYPPASLTGDEQPAAQPTQPNAGRIELPNGFILETHGLLRLRSDVWHNFGLDADDRSDHGIRFFDTRAYIDLRVGKGPFAFISSVDLAGNEFDDGAVLGNDQPPLGPAGLREFRLAVRQLAFEYQGPVRIEFGRIPHQLGQGILTHIFRDSIRVTRSLGAATVVGSWVFGGEGVTSVDSSTAVVRPENSPFGTAENLDAFLFLGNWTPAPQQRVQTFVAWQVDSTWNDRNPQKLFINTNGTGRVGRFSYVFEVAYMGGETPAAGTTPFATETPPSGPRRNNRATLLFATLGYQVGQALPPPPPVYQLANRLRPPGTVGIRVGRGSGDTDPIDRTQRNFENLFMDETGFTYTFLFSDDLHGFAGRTADLRRGAGFANVTFLQPYMQIRPVPELNVFASYTASRATEAQREGTGVLGDLRGPRVERERVRLTHDIGHELDVLVDYDADSSVRLFAYGGIFWPGKIFPGPAGTAWKLELGTEFRF